jgi:hypothetical protein
MIDEEAPFALGDIVEFHPLYGEDYLKHGHIYGRVDGQHFYDQWVVDLQKMELREGSMVPVGTRLQGVKIFMVPAWMVRKVAFDDSARHTL